MKETKELPIIEVPASGKPKWYGGAYTIAFVTSKKGNFILKGYVKEVEEFLKKNHTHYFVNLTLWSDGEYRSLWQFWKDGVYIKHNITKQNRRHKKSFPKNRITFVRFGEKSKELHFRRMPNRWLPEFDQF